MYNLSSHYRSEIAKIPVINTTGFPRIECYSTGFMEHILENPSLCFLSLW